LTDFIAATEQKDVPIPGMSSATLNTVFAWIIFQQRVDLVFDWQLPWTTYVAGFGTLGSNFWIGLGGLCVSSY